ncbi:GGDEF domain-containing protein [Chloroflexales bacterium ZM16-3]|nr:GGDEF domain-containing protein [Chloroflexales bacterium ZM16-3]
MINRLISTALRALERLPLPAHMIISAVGLAALMIFDLATDASLALTMLYLVPVTLSSWYVSARSGQILVAFSSIVWLADGLLFQVSVPIAFWNAGIRLIFFLIFIALLTNLRDSYHREHALARRDPLTGAFNRRAFHDQLEYELARVRRIALPLTLAYIDLDNFKAINDLLGHSVGDELLIRITELMCENLRTIDQVARLGGDEFVILMPGTDSHAAEIALSRLKDLLQGAMQANHWPVTLSVGAVSFYEVPTSLDQAISLADHTMYAVKQRGKDDVQVIVWGQEKARAQG